MHKENKTQEQRILEYLQGVAGKWVSGRHFIQTMMISQTHARIWSLQQKGYEIEASDFKDEFGFKSYRLLEKTAQPTMF